MSSRKWRKNEKKVMRKGLASTRKQENEEADNNGKERDCEQTRKAQQESCSKVWNDCNLWSRAQRFKPRNA